MTEQISITLPLTHSALTNAAAMLTGLADDLNPVFTAEEVAETKNTAAVAETPPSPEAKEVFGTPAEATTQETTPPAPEATAIDVDSDGLPWDVRIHASTKTTLAKTGQWKKKRGVDQTLVEEVEAELRAAMAIPAPSAEAAVKPLEDIHGSVGAVEGTPPAPEAEVIDTFPKLMQAITAAGIDPDTVQGAVAAVGLASLPLVATRPDLIPAVAQGLGL